MSIPTQFLLMQLKKSEGFRPKPYVCPTGHATIGYGHNLEAHPQAIRQWDANLAAQVEAAELAGKSLAGKSLVDALNRTGMVWDESYAWHWLANDVRQFAARLELACPQYCGLLARGDEVRAEVLVDMAFNMGVGGLLNFRKMLAAIDQGDFGVAADEMLNSQWARQVGKRAEHLARQMRMGVR